MGERHGQEMRFWVGVCKCDKKGGSFDIGSRICASGTVRNLGDKNPDWTEVWDAGLAAHRLIAWKPSKTEEGTAAAAAAASATPEQSPDARPPESPSVTLTDSETAAGLCVNVTGSPLVTLAEPPLIMIAQSADATSGCSESPTASESGAFVGFVAVSLSGSFSSVNATTQRVIRCDRSFGLFRSYLCRSNLPGFLNRCSDSSI
jgi:hypothetical protein